MTRAPVLALIFFGFLAFANAIGHPFVQDDIVFILKNPHIADLKDWPRAFGAPTVSVDVNPYYRPVLEIIYRLEYHFFGFDPSRYHLVNITLHIMNGLLIFALLQRLGFVQVFSWVIALLFLIHPIQTEAVACISGISNLWMAFAVLLALHAYLSRWLAASLLCFVLAFLGKEQALMLLPLLVLMDCYRADKNYFSWLAFGAGAIILLALRQLVTGASLLHVLMTHPGELWLRLAAIPWDIGMYLRLVLLPYDLHYYRSTDILQPHTIPWLTALAFVLVLVLVYKRNLKARPIIFLGFGWFLAALLPVLNVAPVINEYSFILTSEHFLYLPMVGVLIVVVSAADHFIKRSRKLLLAFLVGGCLLLTWYQNAFWSSEIALFERMLRYEPDFGRGHLLLAKAYYFNGQPQAADGHFKKAYLIMSGYAHKTGDVMARNFYLGFVKETLFDWAHNYSAMGRWDAALDKYRQAAFIDSHDASLYNNMAFVDLHLGDKKDAYLNLQKARQLDPAQFARP